MLGIPTHLAPRVNAWSTVRAFHAAAVAALAAAAAVLVLFHVAEPGHRVLPALVALVPMLIVIGVHTQSGTWRSATAFLVVGGASAGWFAFVVEREFESTGYVASYLVSLAIVPLVLVGGSGAVPGRVILWSLGGFLVGRVTTAVGGLQADGGVQPAVLAWITLALVVGIVGVGARTTSKLQRVQPELLRSAREEHVSAFRAGVEAEAAAILHDTVLNHLNAIAVSPAGPMDEHLARTVDADFAMLSGRSWLADDTSTAPVSTVPVVTIDGAAGALPGVAPGPSAASDAGRTGPGSAEPDRASRHDGAVFRAMVDEQRGSGLRIDVTGDPDVVARLDGRAATAVVRATAQCLANVRRHAGTDHAEVSVFDDGVGCTVMVVDDGRGFDESATGPDRLGLKNSVRQRIGRVGGDVQVWSSPGTGTSVMMTVPYRAPRTGPVTVADDDRLETAS